MILRADQAEVTRLGHTLAGVEESLRLATEHLAVSRALEDAAQATIADLRSQVVMLKGQHDIDVVTIEDLEARLAELLAGRK